MQPELKILKVNSSGLFYDRPHELLQFGSQLARLGHSLLAQSLPDCRKEGLQGVELRRAWRKEEAPHSHPPEDVGDRQPHDLLDVIALEVDAVDVGEDRGSFEAGPDHSLLVFDILLQLDDGWCEILMVEKAWFDLIEINLIFIRCHKQWNIVLLFLIGFLIIDCYCDAVEVLAEEIAGECDFINEDVVGVYFCQLLEDSGEDHAGLDVFSCVLLHGMGFYVIEGEAHLGEMSGNDWSGIDLAESSEDVLGELDCCVEWSLVEGFLDVALDCLGFTVFSLF